ncbi:SDR family oxidoreductase [Vibrio cholerae]|uniref:SDR family oxidoreductase n=1 Tax=Vibrio cholerae TaxID=666 RepID=UPI00053C1588|nr:SDR family oxidoreductase [Vibrio cholerae]EJL6461482.1 SDR family oxidoreductase [Vibrio cholerae]ELV5027619.1 SDR family oxidoreductase [Vibrio cholerae]MBO1392367.1 short-chain dehydrogenase [Vibrio cholerae]
MTAVFITGATSGIGKQLALDYAKQGWQVIACGRNQPVLDSLHTQYANIFPLAFDVTDHPGTKAALAQLPCQPELWILNAGDCEYIDDGKMDVTLMARVFNINVLGVAAVIEGIQPHLSRGHRVAIVGSIASELALPRAEAYGASKAAVAYLARTLQLDWRPLGIEVTTIFPGFVATPLTDRNTFAMPMIITVERAAQEIKAGLARGVSQLYFPKRFTWLIRLLGALPYTWQGRLVRRLLKA